MKLKHVLSLTLMASSILLAGAASAEVKIALVSKSLCNCFFE